MLRTTSLSLPFWELRRACLHLQLLDCSVGLYFCLHISFFQFKSTSDHVNADGLCRLPLSDSKKVSVVCSFEPSVFNFSQIESLLVTAAQVEAATRTDPIFSKVLHYTKQGWPAKHGSFKALLSAKSRTDGGGRMPAVGNAGIVIPKKLHGQILQKLHRDQPGASRMKSSARSYFWWPCLNREIENLSKTCSACQSIRHAPATAPLPMGMTLKTMATHPCGLSGTFLHFGDSGCSFKVARSF